MLVCVFDNQALSMKCVYEWFARFRVHLESASDQTRRVRPATSVSDENIVKPDLNPPDFLLSPPLKIALKEKRFDDISDIQRNMTRLLNSIPKEDFLQSIRNMYCRSQLWIAMGGGYFEG
ncbi:hypothetical protein TNCV_1444731 [Trichonephila clavipes]|nr:hypothetical protein TNCV_1444731 [Trichonephila clavipes]